MGLFDLIVDVVTTPAKIVVGTLEATKEAVEDIIDDIVD